MRSPRSSIYAVSTERCCWVLFVLFHYSCLRFFFFACILLILRPVSSFRSFFLCFCLSVCLSFFLPFFCLSVCLSVFLASTSDKDRCAGRYSTIVCQHPSLFHSAFLGAVRHGFQTLRPSQAAPFSDTCGKKPSQRNPRVGRKSVYKLGFAVGIWDSCILL